ncbi:hypothetical protein PRUPE_1G509600 [Prunus persica]|uniref:Uncharacterized protein n=1 Tax=Prunus persica TaxID=3760 RepID=A0A251RG84_PRUPE|nr:hypothetical protein PRUPE_1G509600 [Prunus persica]
MDMLDEFDDYMNAQRKSLATKAITATTTVKMDAAKDTATTTDVEMDAATATIKMDAAIATVEMDAATAAPKHKGSDSPAVVEIAIEKRKRCDSLVGVEINALQPPSKLMPLQLPSKSMPLHPPLKSMPLQSLLKSMPL